MGLISKLLSFTRVVRNGANISDVKVDPGGGPNITAEHFSAPGDDSFPLPTDYVHTAPVPGSHRQAAVGYVDPINAPVSAAGEKRIYGRDSSGAAVNQVWLQADGSVLISNDSGLIRLRPSGTVEINGALISAAGLITSPLGVEAPSMVADGKDLKDHTHPAGTPPGDTGVNN